MSYAPLCFARTSLTWERTYVMGVLNVTPDSFSDGGRYDDVDAAIAHGRTLIDDGADIVDVGGESTRPVGARTVSAAEECERVVPVIRGLATVPGAVIAIDTTKAAVARAALEAGAEIVNDISGGAFEPAIVDVVAEAGAVYICSHARGRNLPEVHASQDSPASFDEVTAELARTIAALPPALRHRTIADPGLGFGKGTPENVALLRGSAALAAATGCPVLVGPSRKRFLGDLTGAPVDQRDVATVGACLAAVSCGAHILRVHDVKLLRSALSVYEAVMGGVG